ncbi:MAG: RdgB/HAM1 family non-canonical purine NTP pyrophosphatase [Roseibacillus sp.]|nr:RdgB/HAM1 family non-canonical purine NTP pyrophosphatase [Roseibacillus sp.]
MERPSLLIATRNSHKTQEIAVLLGSSFYVCDLSALPESPEVEETGATFLENATLKARALSECTDALVLADDSGLEVDALGGEPGVCSARYAGPEADDDANNRKLILELAGVPADRRTGRFRCVIVAAQGGQILADFAGTVEGSLASEPKGSEGFGYDPLFVPKGYQQSFAEMGPGVKNKLSHRAKAMNPVAQWLRRR